LHKNTIYYQTTFSYKFNLTNQNVRGIKLNKKEKENSRKLSIRKNNWNWNICNCSRGHPHWHKL